MAQTADDIPSDDSIPVSLRGERAGTIVETAPTAAAIMQRCAFRLARQGGAMLAIDYGYSGPAAGDTLQAVKAHRFADPFAAPGEVDLTAHVDFVALADRSEEHTSELQSLMRISYAVFCLNKKHK